MNGYTECLRCGIKVAEDDVDELITWSKEQICGQCQIEETFTNKGD